jgi:2-amino-4-hydroxy-6-hydroxymethyldihydropteridine diphosphokinase
MVRTFLSLGSNLGNRSEYLNKGIEALNRNSVAVVRRAAIYETEPLEVTDQPWFLNTVVEANTGLEPHQLMVICLSIARENQRVRSEIKTARTLDLDIIFYGDRIIHERELTIPHPRFRERKFVLVPLAEIAPDFVDPASGQSVATLLQKCPDASVIRPLQGIP